MFWPLCCVIWVLLAHICKSQTNVSLIISNGPIVGHRWDPSPSTKASYDAFLGIPYGQIPGRFQPPVPRSNWSTPLVTQADGPACPQPTLPYSEDCLFLNVFTPVNASQTPRKFPVIAYIHGSAFTVGSSSSAIFGPDFLVPQGIILVTMNYRLGAAGSLTLGSSSAPGNLGLHDTQLGLRWIQAEIAAFGGDPDQVTLMGHSAGAAMTMFHYLSPVSSGLFQRAIAHSGSALSTWAHVSAEEAVRRTKLLADAVGCNSSLNDSMLLSCLQQISINSIVIKQNISLPVENLASGNSFTFVPVIDTNFGNPPFFTDSIDNLLKEALNRSKPLMAGFTTEEGIFKFRGEDWKLVQSNLKAFIPRGLQSPLSDNQKTIIGNKIKSHYFPETVDEDRILDVVYIYTDYMFAHPTIEVIRHFSNWTYGYVFAYEGPWAPLPAIFTKYHVTGVSHGADLHYLFYSGQDISPCPSNLPNLAIRDKMVQWWTNFVKNGVPDSSGNWSPASNGHYLMVDSTVSTVNASEVEERHYNFWANLNANTDNSATRERLNLLVVLVTLWCLISMSI